MEKDNKKSSNLTVIFVVSIILLLLTMQIMANMENKMSNRGAKAAVTRSAISMIADALEAFKVDMGDYPYPAEPEKGEGLLALVNRDDVNLGMKGTELNINRWKGPYLKTRRLENGKREVPKDGWSRPFAYQSDGKEGFVISSKGGDVNEKEDDIIEYSYEETVTK